MNDLAIPKGQPVLIYCTGGIRCEKAAPALRAEGYSEVYQLKGGILKYLEERPDSMYEGECFVFDDRVAVDQRLRPSRTYAFCPHCGYPAKDMHVCSECGAEAKICETCSKGVSTTCSKECANKLRAKSERSETYS